jgi:general L-amino acid transport system permease protein
VSLLLLVPGAALAAWFLRWTDRRRRAGRPLPVAGVLSVAVALAPAVAAWLAAGAPAGWSIPALRGFNFAGGLALSPEFLALYFGLSFYIAAFVAEIVRAGILAVGRGQVEAAQAIGLGRADLYRRIVFPAGAACWCRHWRPVHQPRQNSSLGVAIGTPDLFSVTNTVLTLSGTPSRRSPSWRSST